jgi:type III restriction enzyme
VRQTNASTQSYRWWALEGKEHDYLPNFIARVDDAHGKGDLLNLIVEVSGEARKDKAATARTLWAPAINNHGGYERWAFVEITDTWDAMGTIRAFLKGNSGEICS